MATSATAKAATAGTVAAMWKLGIAGVAAASIAVGGLALSGEQDEHESESTRQAPAIVERPAPRPRAAAHESNAVDGGLVGQEIPPAPPAEVREVPRQRPARDTVSETAVQSEPPDDLIAQVELLSRAVEAIGRGDASRALVLLDEHEARFPNSSLATERDRARQRAMRLLGPTEQK